MKRWQRPSKKDRLIWFVKTRVNRWTNAKANGFEFRYPEFCTDPEHKAKCIAIDKAADAFAERLEKMSFAQLLPMVKRMKANEVLRSKQ